MDEERERSKEIQIIPSEEEAAPAQEAPAPAEEASAEPEGVPFKGNDRQCFVDRELSWLQFNLRVLETAGDPTVPLLERLKFLGIYRSNMEEFFMVRVGSLTHRAMLFPGEKDEKTGWTAAEQLSQIMAEVNAQQSAVQKVYRGILQDLKEVGVDVIDFRKVGKMDEVVARKYFSEIRPLLSPRVVDAEHPFPFIANKEHWVAVALKKGEKGDELRLGLVPLLRVPLYKVVEIAGGDEAIINAEMVRYYASLLFKKQEVRESALIQVTRNADVFIDRFDEDFRSSMEKMLRKRKRQQPVRLQVIGKPSAAQRSSAEGGVFPLPGKTRPAAELSLPDHELLCGDAL